MAYRLDGLSDPFSCTSSSLLLIPVPSLPPPQPSHSSHLLLSRSSPTSPPKPSPFPAPTPPTPPSFYREVSSIVEPHPLQGRSPLDFSPIGFDQPLLRKSHEATSLLMCCFYGTELCDASSIGALDSNPKASVWSVVALCFDVSFPWSSKEQI